MNQRIKEFAEQTGYYLYDLTETHGIKTVETDDKDEWITLEKFAELIVRECLDVMSKTSEEANKRFTYMGDDVPTVVHQMNIEKHFEVE